MGPKGVGLWTQIARRAEDFKYHISHNLLLPRHSGPDLSIYVFNPFDERKKRNGRNPKKEAQLAIFAMYLTLGFYPHPCGDHPSPHTPCV